MTALNRVAIPTIGGKELELLLNDLVEARRDVEFEVRVYASDEQSRSAAQKMIERRPQLSGQSRLARIGYSSARNDAWSDALSEGVSTLVFLDDDIRLVEGSLKTLIDMVIASESTAMFAGFSLRTYAGTSPLHSLLHTQTEPDPNPTALPSYMLAFRPSALPADARLPEALDFTGGEDTMLTRWMYDQGVKLVNLPGVSCTEEDPESEFATRMVLFRRAANSAVLALHNRSGIAPWLWERSTTEHGRVGAVLKSAFDISLKVNARLAYQIARVSGRFMGQFGFVPMKRNDYWGVVRINTRQTELVNDPVESGAVEKGSSS